MQIAATSTNQPMPWIGNNRSTMTQASPIAANRAPHVRKRYSSGSRPREDARNRHLGVGGAGREDGARRVGLGRVVPDEQGRHEVSFPERLRLTTIAARVLTMRVITNSTKPAVSSALSWMPVASPN